MQQSIFSMAFFFSSLNLFFHAKDNTLHLVLTWESSSSTPSLSRSHIGKVGETQGGDITKTSVDHTVYRSIKTTGLCHSVQDVYLLLLFCLSLFP